MKNILKTLSIFIIALFPITFVNAESRTETILEKILENENFKEMHAKATYEDDNIHINWMAPKGSNTKEIGFSVSGNVIEYTPGEITNYDEATLETSHLIYASSILQAALVLNGYTEDQINEFNSVPNYEINGYEFVEMGEQQEYSDGKGSTIYVTPYSIKIDVSKANLNTSINEELPTAGTTVEDVVNALNSDEEFTTTEYEGVLYYSVEVELLSDELTVSATSYDYDYYWVSYQCEDDILTYEVNIDEITNYDEAESVMSHNFMASYILQKALELNGYSAQEYAEFISSENNTLTYELNGIEIKELGEAKSYTSEDETSSSTITVAPMSIKIDLARVNLKKQADATGVAYQTLDGANQKFDQSKDKQLVFRFSIDYDKFLSEGKVFIDNKEVPKDKYSVLKGSTIITLSNEYANTLSEGSHTIQASVSDGAASTQFTVTKNSSSNNPKTGDNIVFYIVMFGLSIIGLVGAGIYTKKRKFN